MQHKNPAGRPRYKSKDQAKMNISGKEDREHYSLVQFGILKMWFNAKHLRNA